MVVEVFESEKIDFFDFFLPIFEYFFKIKTFDEKNLKTIWFINLLELKGHCFGFLS